MTHRVYCASLFIQNKGSEGGALTRQKISKKKEPPSTPDKEEWIDVDREVVDAMFGERPEERAAFQQLGEMSKVC